MQYHRDRNAHLLDFLEQDLFLSSAAIAMALRLCHQNAGPLPMILWQYGFVSLRQLNQIFDWLEQ